MISPAQLQMHLELVGGRLVAAMAVLLAVVRNAASAQEHMTYRCKVADVVPWGDDGLRPDSNPKEKDAMRQMYDGVIIDTLTGAVSLPCGHTDLWKVIKMGDGRGGYDHFLNAGGRDYPLVNQFIRIRDLGGKPPRFLASWLDSFTSGPCEVVR